MQKRVIVCKSGDGYLVGFYNEGEAIEKPLDDYRKGQLINTKNKVVGPIQLVGSILNMVPNFEWFIVEDEVEIERLYALAREEFVK
jgi:hypothetical protein